MATNGSCMNILINAPYSILGDWSAFSLCYSLQRFLPDASIFINYTKNLQINKQLFTWLRNLNIKNLNKLTAPFLNLHSHHIMIRPMENIVFTSETVCSEIKEDKFTPFVSYQKGCGKFVMDEWINKDEYPFSCADSFMTEGVGANEIQVLRLWKQMNTLYPLLIRG